MDKFQLAEITGIAETVRNHYGIGCPITSVDEMVKRMGGEIREVDSITHITDSRIAKAENIGGFIVEVPCYQSGKRRRFTICHELGHLFLHMRYMLDQDSWEALDITEYYKTPETEEQEDRASAFGEALLMPEKEFREEVARNTSGGIVDIKMVAEYFDVPVDVARHRSLMLGCRENIIPSGILLFFSFDIVGSTLYKAKNRKTWHNDYIKTFEQLRMLIHRKIKRAVLWKGLGDELLYYVELTDPESIPEYVSLIYETLQEMNRCDDGKEKLYLKSTAWLSIVGDGRDVPDDVDYSAADLFVNNDTGIQVVDFYGADIDTGFRIAKEARKSQLILSFDLAQILAQDPVMRDRLLIVSFTSLKGVWNGFPYPVIWYYDKELFGGKKFRDSDAYDIMEHDENFPEYFKALHFLESEGFGACLAEIRRQMKLEAKLGYLLDASHYNKMQNMFS